MLFRGPVEDRVDYVESDHSAPHDRAGGHGPPQNIGPGKVPNGQQTGNDRNQDTRARSPEGYLCDYARIKEASFQWILLSSAAN